MVDGLYISVSALKALTGSTAFCGSAWSQVDCSLTRANLHKHDRVELEISRTK